jgi:hypothetical protein
MLLVYLRRAEEVASKTGTRQVLVATEDPDVVAELARLNARDRNAGGDWNAGSNALRFYWTDSERRGLRISIPQVTETLSPEP